MMTVSVLVEPVGASGFRATLNEAWGLFAEGTTKEEAMEHLRDLVAKRLSTGAEMRALDVAGGEKKADPWEAGFGMFRDNPMFDEWQEAIREYRREQDAEDEAVESEQSAKAA
jgi:hypothetical protein